MTQTPQIRAALVAMLQSVPGIGVVHGYERYAADRSNLRALYVAETGGQEQLLGWFVRRSQFSIARITPGRRAVTTTWSITGYMALADALATELAMDALVDAITEAHNADPTLGGLVKLRREANPAGVTLEDAGPVMFAGVLCHAVTLRLVTEHNEDAPAGLCG